MAEEVTEIKLQDKIGKILLKVKYDSGETIETGIKEIMKIIRAYENELV